MRHNGGLLISIKISLPPMLIPCAPTKKEVDKTKKSGLGYRTFKATQGRLICHTARSNQEEPADPAKPVSHVNSKYWAGVA